MCVPSRLWVHQTVLCVWLNTHTDRHRERERERERESERMRPRIVLFGDSITEQSFRSGGWGAALADTYTRKVDPTLIVLFFWGKD